MVLALAGSEGKGGERRGEKRCTLYDVHVAMQVSVRERRGCRSEEYALMLDARDCDRSRSQLGLRKCPGRFRQRSKGGGF